MRKASASGMQKIKDLQIDHFRRMGKDSNGLKSERILKLDTESRKHLLALLCPKSGEVLLELGCGEVAIKKLLPNNVAYVGIDIYLPILKGSKAQVIHSPMEQLPIKSGSIDLIFCRQALEHTFDYNLLLGEAWRVLKPMGKIVSETPHYFPDVEPAHITQQTIFQWQLHFVKNNFHVLKTEFRETTAFMSVILAEKCLQPHYLSHLILFLMLSLFRRHRILLFTKKILSFFERREFSRE